VAPSRPRGALICLAFATLLVLPPLDAARAEEAATPAGETAASTDPTEQDQARDPSAGKSRKSKRSKKESRRRSRKQKREETRYQVDPKTAKVFEEWRQHFELQQYAEADASLGELNLERLGPHERAETHRRYGYNAYGQEQHDVAIEHLQKAIAEGDEGLPPRDRADVLFQIAQIQAAKARWQDVIETLQTWFQIVERPNSVGYFMLALAHFQLEDLDGALEPAKQAVEIAKRPQQAWLQLLLAIHLTRQDYAAATPVLDRMIALYPNSGKDYWLQLSSLHGVTGDDKRALGVLELAYRKGLLTDDRDLLRLLQLSLARGIPYRAARVFEQAVAEERFQGDAEALELQGVSWILAREPGKAVEPLTRAAELSKTGELYLHLGQIHLLEEQWEQAAVALRKALAKGGLSDPGTAQLMLGIAYYYVEQLQEARSWFNLAQRSSAMREQAEVWLQHVDREIETQGSDLGTGG
jgi:tetratricopeptide (TPR) repeat protein